MPTDQELTNAVHAAVRVLNDLIEQASKEGLVVEIEEKTKHIIQVVSDQRPVPVFEASILRKLRSTL